MIILIEFYNYFKICDDTEEKELFEDFLYETDAAEGFIFIFRVDLDFGLGVRSRVSFRTLLLIFITKI